MLRFGTSGNNQDHVFGLYPVIQTGRAPSGVQTTTTDIWDRADATPTQSLWTAPTVARIHAVVSGSANDTAAGTGARTVKVYGLTSWSAVETSETVIMAGATPVNTVGSYVIIHRIVVLTTGTGGTNAGAITATAATDTTITAVIRAGVGQTEMAIYGWPSSQKLYVTSFSASIQLSSAAASHAIVRMFYNPEPNALLAHFNEIEMIGLESAGFSSNKIEYNPNLVLPGPGILKINALASANDLDMTARFTGFLADN